jgi:HAD superfamily phosphoserine phosphatase-like hydrolase
MTKQKFAVFDIDGTVFRWQLYYEVELKLAAAGAFPKQAATKLEKAYFDWQARNASFSDFEKIALSLWNEYLPKLPAREFDSMVTTVLDESSHKIYNYTLGLIHDLKAKGYFLLAISGSYQEIAEPFAKKYGFDACIGWLYERKGEFFTGRTLRKTVGNKQELLRDFVAKNNLSWDESVAVGDGKGDIPLLASVEQPIAFNPAHELFEAALQKGWPIVIERKNIAYTLERSHDGSYVLAKTDIY